MQFLLPCVVNALPHPALIHGIPSTSPNLVLTSLRDSPFLWQPSCTAQRELKPLMLPVCRTNAGLQCTLDSIGVFPSIQCFFTLAVRKDRSILFLAAPIDSFLALQEPLGTNHRTGERGGHFSLYISPPTGTPPAQEKRMTDSNQRRLAR